MAKSVADMGFALIGRRRFLNALAHDVSELAEQSPSRERISKLEGR